MKLTLQSTVPVAAGLEMPRLGFGTYKSLPGEVEGAVEHALRCGYRSIDTASLYGNEEGIAQGIAASGVDRAEIFLTTKVWNDEQGYDGTRAALERSLARLRTDRVDLYLVHWPMREKMRDTWRAMESLLDQGLTRAIGVCNHLSYHLDALLAHASVAPALDQVEFHPWLQQPGLQEYLADHGIVLEAWAPLMKGRIAEEPLLGRIATSHGVTPAQVAIRWVLQQGHIAIPKSVHEARIESNADVFGFELDDAEMAELARADRNVRLGPDPDVYAW